MPRLSLKAREVLTLRFESALSGGAISGHTAVAIEGVGSGTGCFAGEVASNERSISFRTSQSSCKRSWRLRAADKHCNVAFT